MKRVEKVWWFIIFLIFMVMFEITLFHITNVFLKNEMSITRPINTPDLFSSHNFEDESSQNEDQSSKTTQSVILMHPSCNSSINHFTTRQDVPLWEKSFKTTISTTANLSLPIIMIWIFLIFYQTARTSAEEDLPDNHMDILPKKRILLPFLMILFKIKFQ